MSIVAIGCNHRSTPLDALDVNDDGALEIADAVQLLYFLFLGGPPPSLPFPSPGLDPTPFDAATSRRQLPRPVQYRLVLS